MTNEAEGLDLDALEKVAREAAVQSRWQNGIEDLEGVVAPDEPGLGNVICLPPTKRMYSSREDWPSHANHIATFDPPTVLRLLAALRAQAERVLVLEGLVEETAKAGRERAAAVRRSLDAELSRRQAAEARAEAAERRAGELEGALREAEATLALVEHPRREDPIHGAEVNALGARIGYGALMASAQASWRAHLEASGDPLGGEYVAGPCFATVQDTLRVIRAALLPATQAEGEK